MEQEIMCEVLATLASHGLPATPDEYISGLRESLSLTDREAERLREAPRWLRNDRAVSACVESRAVLAEKIAAAEGDPEGAFLNWAVQRACGIIGSHCRVVARHSETLEARAAEEQAYQAWLASETRRAMSLAKRRRVNTYLACGNHIKGEFWGTCGGKKSCKACKWAPAAVLGFLDELPLAECVEADPSCPHLWGNRERDFPQAAGQCFFCKKRWRMSRY